jgi:hypothetical protein
MKFTLSQFQKYVSYLLIKTQVSGYKGFTRPLLLKDLGKN